MVRSGKTGVPRVNGSTVADRSRCRLLLQFLFFFVFCSKRWMQLFPRPGRQEKDAACCSAVSQRRGRKLSSPLRAFCFGWLDFGEMGGWAHALRFLLCLERGFVKTYSLVIFALLAILVGAPLSVCGAGGELAFCTAVLLRRLAGVNEGVRVPLLHVRACRAGRVTNLSTDLTFGNRD